MSTALQRRYQAFVGEFAAPLVCGGEMRVGRPLGERELRWFTSGTRADDPAIAAIIDARDAVAREMLVRPPALLPLENDVPALQLLVAAHNLMALTHPSLRAGLVARRAHTRIAAFTRGLLAGIPAAATPRDAVALHTVLWNLPRARRTDRTVRYWAGTRHYVGQAPPARMVRWPRLRRVQVEEAQRTWMAEGLQADDERVLLRDLLQRSPVTDLCHVRDGFRATPALAALAAPGLCRYVTDRLLERGLAGVAVPLCAAFDTALGEADAACPLPVLRWYAAFLVNLMITVVFAGGPPALGALIDPARPLLGRVALLVEREERPELGPPLGVRAGTLLADRDARTADVGRALLSLAQPGAPETLLGAAEAERLRLAIRRRFAAGVS
ncbi:MAG TPA: hypothetical protein VG389_14470 [Myxococcota bacterium]|nr:hypothetical protein [Myxococcota bacterium]